jgi:hypothetical protein
VYQFQHVQRSACRTCAARYVAGKQVLSWQMLHWQAAMQQVPEVIFLNARPLEKINTISRSFTGLAVKNYICSINFYYESPYKQAVQAGESARSLFP